MYKRQTVASVILGCGSPSVCADDYESDWNTNDTIALGNFYIGNNSQSGIKREDETTLYKGVLGDGIGLSFSLGNANYEDIEGTQGLLAQGTSGFRQFIFESGDLSIRLEGIDRFDKMFNSTLIYIQPCCPFYEILQAVELTMLRSFFYNGINDRSSDILNGCQCMTDRIARHRETSLSFVDIRRQNLNIHISAYHNIFLSLIHI